MLSFNCQSSKIKRNPTPRTASETKVAEDPVLFIESWLQKQNEIHFQHAKIERLIYDGKTYKILTIYVDESGKESAELFTIGLTLNAKLTLITHAPAAPDYAWPTR